MTREQHGEPLRHRRDASPPEGEWHPARPSETETDIPHQGGRQWRGARFGDHTEETTR